MRVAYCGPMAAVELPDLGVVARGEMIEVGERLGWELCSRNGEWKEETTTEKQTERKMRKGGTD